MVHIIAILGLNYQKLSSKIRKITHKSDYYFFLFFSIIIYIYIFLIWSTIFDNSVLKLLLYGPRFRINQSYPGNGGSYDTISPHKKCWLLPLFWLTSYSPRMLPRQMIFSMRCKCNACWVVQCMFCSKSIARTIELFSLHCAAVWMGCSFFN